MITIHHLTKSFNGFTAVNDLNLHIEQGAYVALLGPNGAGKTTLVEMIEGLQTPTSGEITINNQNWQHHADDLRRLIGLSLQETKFVDKMTVKETLDLFGSFYHLPQQRTREILQAVNLESKQNTFTVKLSGGQRQRLALGVALMNEPQVLLLDEPTTGLDPNARREVWDILTQLRQKQHTTMILTTHYMEEAQYLCDRIVIMDQGKILADGTLENLLDMYDQGEIISFRLEQPLLPEMTREIPGLQHYDNQNAYHEGQLIVDEITSALPAFLALIERHQLGMRELECRKKTLDDLFVSMTGRRLDA
uniref:ABC transporter ATP-binding protein n=1 Tax=Roseihalotalea indica TaxID=2867963 RepID=A0AA49GKK7_9BACT|nr:ABC transporter ATP-binding protein [Tunicatimonas sp. TK19036]